MINKDNLKQKTAIGVFWNFFQNIASSGLSFLIMLVLARILSPDDYGVIGIIVAFIAVADVFVDSGFASALIQKKNRTQVDLSTVFYYNVLASIFIYFFLFISAPYIADFYDIPILKLLLRVLSLKIFISSFSSIQYTLLRIQLNFKTLARINIFATLLSGIVGIIMALLNCGVWALVGLSMTLAIVNCFQFWCYSKWRPSRVFSVSSFKSLFTYGSNLLVSSLIETIYNNIYTVVIGKLFSASSLGHYSRANHFAAFPSTNFSIVLGRVTFPALSQIQDDDERLRASYLKLLKMSSFIVFPLMTGLAGVAIPFVTIVIGEKWLFCAQLLQIICFSMMWYPIHSINLNLLKVKARSDLFLKLEIIKKLLGISILVISVPFGIVTMCYFSILSSLISLIINTYYSGKLINLGFLKQMRTMLPTFGASFTMFVVVLLVQEVFQNTNMKFAFGVLSGSLTYVAITRLLKFEEWKEVNWLIKQVRYL